MRFGPTLLLSATAAAAAANCGEGDTRSVVSHAAEIADVLVQQQYNPVDTETTASFAARASKEQPLNIHFPTQPQNQTSEPMPNEHVQKRTDSSTPGTQIMSPWRQVIGGIAVAVLVGVV